MPFVLGFFIFDHLQRRADLQRCSPTQDVDRVVQRHLLVVDDVPDVSA